MAINKSTQSRIAHIEQPEGDGFMVSLKRGFFFNEKGTHVFGEDTWADVLESMQRTGKCDCPECRPQPKHS